MDDFLNKLGAMARKAADQVNTDLTIAQLEQKLKDAYQALGRVCYRMLSDNEMPEGDEVQRHLQTIASLQQQLQDLKVKRAVE